LLPKEKMKKKKRELMRTRATTDGGCGYSCWWLGGRWRCQKGKREVSVGAEEPVNDGWRGEMKARVIHRRWTIEAVEGSS
jgi:hypothetical protein